MAKTLELDRCCKELIEPESDIASQALRRWPPPLQELHCPVDSAMVSSLHGCADKVGIFLNLLDASSGRCNLHEIK
jgi:hypothetical protein